jgi:hypothetical protein
VGYDPFATNQVVLDYNYAWGTNVVFNYNNVDYSAAQLGSAIGYSNNVGSYRPDFTFGSGYDIHLTQHDQTNMTAKDLTYLVAMGATNIDRDIYGTLRATVGWQAGAASIQRDTNLVAWWNFNAYHDTNSLPDSSPFANDLVLFSFPSNAPTLTNGPSGLSAVSCRAYRYFGTTNWNRLERMTNWTIISRGRYSSTSAGDTALLDFGIDVANAWHLGRDNSFFNTGFWVATDGGAYTQAIAFPDNFSSGQDSGWWHFAVTGRRTGASVMELVAYTNGVVYQTNTLTGLSFISPSNPSHWAAVGCDTHNGTPAFDDDEGATPDNGFHSYPNNAFGAWVSDSKIYSSTLSAADVMNEFLGIGTQSGGGGGGGGGQQPALVGKKPKIRRRP